MKFKIDMECYDNKTHTFEVETDAGYCDFESPITHIYYHGREIKSDNVQDNDIYLCKLTTAGGVEDIEIYDFEIDDKEADLFLNELKHYHDCREAYESYKKCVWALKDNLKWYFAPSGHYEWDLSELFYQELIQRDYIEANIEIERDYIRDCKISGIQPYAV